MSIDHGKVLVACRRKLEAYRDAYGLEYVGGQELSSLLADIDRALAQPAEAVEWSGGEIRTPDDFNRAVARLKQLCRELAPQELTGLSEQMTQAFTHDAAQGAVADVALTARRLLADQIPHQITKELLVVDNLTAGVVDTRIALAAIETALRANPQAAPAQWDDTRRLDWLDTQRQDDVGQERNGDPYLIARVWTVYEQKETIREAIDEAMTRAAAPSQEGES